MALWPLAIIGVAIGTVGWQHGICDKVLATMDPDGHPSGN